MNIYYKKKIYMVGGYKSARKKASGVWWMWKPLSWTKHSEIYHRDSTKEWTGKRMPEAYIAQTLEKDQEKEIPWQSKVLYGLHHRQIAEIAILPVAAESRKAVIDSSAGASIKHQIYWNNDLPLYMTLEANWAKTPQKQPNRMGRMQAETTYTER